MYGWEQLPSRYLRHEPCPACNSKDNLARYDGGSCFCFGCGYFERGYKGNSQRGLSAMGGTGKSRGRVAATTSSESENGIRPPPDDTIFGDYPEVVLDWIGRYGLTAVDLIRYKIGWSKRREQLIYHFYGADADLVLWQARNFRAGTTHKDRFYTSGSSAEVVAAYYPKQTGDTACIVEDCVSAIKACQAGVTGIPCIGSSMPEKKLAQVARMYKNVFTWLDEDKFKESNKLARQLSMLGCRTRVIQTKEDPKAYPLDFLEHKLRF
jgi:hypothetical protein